MILCIKVVDRFSAKGMRYLPRETMQIINAIPDSDPHYWFKNTTLVFERK